MLYFIVCQCCAMVTETPDVQASSQSIASLLFRPNENGWNESVGFIDMFYRYVAKGFTIVCE